MDGYRFLALDIDGTLVNSKKEITPAVRAEIRKLQVAGLPVALVSGRPLEGIIHVAKELDFWSYHCYILPFNGGKIIDCRTDKVVYSQAISIPLAHEVCKAAVEFDVAIVTYKDGCIVSSHPDNEYTQFESRITRMPVRGVESMEKEMNFQPDKFLFVGEPDKLEKLLPIMQEKFAGRLNIFRSEPFFMEIVPLGIDKAQSLARLLGSMGMSSAELVACGDGFNDVSMVNYAGMGVAMENACDATKEVADYIAPSCDKDGVAVVVKKFFRA